MSDVTNVTVISESRYGSAKALSIRESRIKATCFLSLQIAFSLASIDSANLTSLNRSALLRESTTIFASLMRSKLESAGYD